MELYTKATPYTNSSFTIGVYHYNGGPTREYTAKYLGGYNFYKLGLTIDDVVLAQKYFDRKSRELYMDNKNINECYDKIIDLCREYEKYNIEN